LTPLRLGVLGGSFNPVHQGHLHLAQASRDIFDLAEVHFVVASVPPHKPARELISFSHRYAMVSLATSGMPGLIPSQIEMDPPVSSYSIDTLAKLERRCDTTGAHLYFIAGGDSLLEFSAWHESSRLLASYNFIFVMRAGFPLPDLGDVLPGKTAGRIADFRGIAGAAMKDRIAAHAASREPRIYVVELGAPDIAASQIRRLASLGKSIEALVPAPVCEYINKLHLYGE
jgi:nicotinate-nucleotide adenylyltransferase